MGAQDTVVKLLRVPPKYLKATLDPDVVVVAAHQTWLSNLIKHGQIPPVFMLHESLSEDEVHAWIWQQENFGVKWLFLSIKVVEKREQKLLSLPRGQPLSADTRQELGFSQLLHYVSQSNHKNLWKEAFKKYHAHSRSSQGKESGGISFVDYEVVVRDVLRRVYKCPFIHLDSKTSRTEASATDGTVRSQNYETHGNVLPAYCILEAEDCFLIVQPHEHFTVGDCVTFSPGVLSDSVAKPLFVLYQLLQFVRDMHDRGLAIGDLTLHDVTMRKNLWIRVMPRMSANIFPVMTCDDNESERSLLEGGEKGGGRGNDEPRTLEQTMESILSALKNEDVDTQVQHVALGQLVDLWVCGRVSNYNYLMVLNYLANRRFGNPNHHPVLPWIMDFSSPYGGWRDFTKSKFRLNKGDRQLDLTYNGVFQESGGNFGVPHHISDVLSEITYYVYKARQTPQEILCKYVRSKWVPAEYPSSIQRMQQWTPDECIPEFFTDPSIFRSIHDDLPDLEIPSWADTPEDFIDSHRAALEGSYVSERLHHWIDLTFGYKLSGVAAVKAKNVCLHLVDMHTDIVNSGVVQLFSHPHPHRQMPSPYLGKVPPKMSTAIRERRRSDKEKAEDAAVEQGSIMEEDDVRPLAFTRFLSRSRTSLVVEKDRMEPKNTPILLPKDYEPVAAINHVESLCAFINRTTHSLPLPDRSGGGTGSEEIVNHKQAVATRRIQDMQVLGCLICELLLPSKCLNLGPAAPLSERFRFWGRLLRWEQHLLPRCVRRVVVTLLLGAPEEGGTLRYPAVSSLGLPPPSAHQLLEPRVSLIPFPSYFGQLYSVLKKISEINAAMWVDLEGSENDMVLKRAGDYKVKLLAKELLQMLPQLDEEGLYLVLPYMQELLEEPHTAVLATWLLFDPVSQALGPAAARHELLDPIVRLYDSDFSSSKHMKLYHRSFILQLVIRFGLQVFLNNFVTLLIEGVGGYRDFCASGGEGRIHPRGEMLRKRRRSSHLSSPEPEVTNSETLLSPFDEDSSQATLPNQEREAQDGSGHDDTAGEEEGPNNDVDLEPEVFVFEPNEETEGGSASDSEVPLDLMEQLERKYLDSSDSNSADAASLNESSMLPSPGTASEEAEKKDFFEEPDGTDGGDPEDLDQTVSQSISKSCGIPVLELKRAQLPHSLPVYSEEMTTYWSNSKEQSKSPKLKREESKVRKPDGECNISDLCADSVVWLAHRLGPVLTAKYLTRNLLRMLTLCYLGEDNLQFLVPQDTFSMANACQKKVVGDQSAGKVLECLSSISALYGEQFIQFQYFPNMAELIASSRRKLLPNLEGGLIGCMALLTHIIPYLADSTLMDQLQDVLVRSILMPTVRLFCSSCRTFPSGGVARLVLAHKTLEAIDLIYKRIGTEMTCKHLLSVLHRFFLGFDKVYKPDAVAETLSSSQKDTERDSSPRSLDDCSYLNVGRDPQTNQCLVTGTVHISVKNSADKGKVGSCGSLSPPVTNRDSEEARELQKKAQQELQYIFTPALAHFAYLQFYEVIANCPSNKGLKNEDLIHQLYLEHDQILKIEQGSGSTIPITVGLPQEPTNEPHVGVTGNLGSNVAIIGNRIDLQKVDQPVMSLISPNASAANNNMQYYSRIMENSGRHLKGNWLAYWEHEIGRAEKDVRFNFKQIKLQTFVGHVNSVRAVHVLDNENSFISCSKDKTVKLWSLRSQGDGQSSTTCQWTYTHHKKSVFAVTFLESLRLAASCDSTVHVWDPFMGMVVRQLDNPRGNPVNVLRAMPPPSTQLLAATMDATLRFIDLRTCTHVQELKASLGPTGLIRCMAVSADGHWIAVGHSTGALSVLDVRTGMLLGSWKGHEGEVLQLVAVNRHTFVSSSLDQLVSVWSVEDGKFRFHLRGPSEPVHCMCAHGTELISGTTANRIGVHTSVDANASFSSTRLRSDTFKGVLTCMTVLPLNQMILLGSDNGTLRLLC